MNHLDENHEHELSVFTPPRFSTGVHTRQWIEHRPTNQIIGESSLEFLFPPQSVGYMDLRRSTLKIKLRLTNALGQPLAKDANVGLVNVPLQCVFSHVDRRLQQTSVTQTGTNYPHKAYIDRLLETGLPTVREGHALIPRRLRCENWRQHRSVHTLHVHGRRSTLGIGRTPSLGRLLAETFDRQRSQFYLEDIAQQTHLSCDIQR